MSDEEMTADPEAIAALTMSSTDTVEWEDGKILRLPYKGEELVFAEASGQRWRQIMQVKLDAEAGKATPDLELYPLSVGQEQWDELIARELPGSVMERIGLAVWLFQAYGDVEMSLKVWMEGKSPAPSTSTSTDGAATTPRRASGSGTSSRTRSKRS